MHEQMQQCAVESLPTEGHALADHCFFWPPIDLRQHSVPCACQGLVDGAIVSLSFSHSCQTVQTQGTSGQSAHHHRWCHTP
jgi:hypothetical protein